MTDDTALERLCSLCGIDSEYTDIWGKRHAVSVTTKQALLAAMGIRAEGEAELRAALAVQENRAWRRALAPVQVVRASQASVRIAVVWPLAQAAEPLEWTLSQEDEKQLTGRVRADELEMREQREIEGRAWGRYALTLPAVPPPGYHRFELRHKQEPCASLSLIVVPDACYQPVALSGEGRVWGPAVQLYALRSKRNWGIGDFTDLRRLVDDCRESGANIVGLNPLHALFPHNPEHASPYSPSSRLFLNTLYLDIEAIPEFAECEAARQLVTAPEFQARLHALRTAELVDYPAVAAAKLPVLEQLHQCFRARHALPGTERGRAFQAFREERGEALYWHALFEALQEHFHAQNAAVWGWPLWPEEFRDPALPAVAQWASAHRERVEFFQYLQWQTDSQLAAVGQRSLELHLGIGLYQDLAVSVDRAGAEVWSNQRLYAVAASIGAPPDDFNLNGQNWGLPPMVPDALREAAYAPFIATLRANMRHGGALRIDHVMGLMRLFWVPAGGMPQDGTYVHYPFADLLGIVALESQRNRCLVIGEDLGTVPDAVRVALAPLGVLSYRLLYFEKDARGEFQPPGAYSAQALVAVTTHDLPTLSGFWHGDDLAERTTLGLFPSDAVRDKQVVGRAEDRARLLLALDREKLLPEGLTVHLASSPDMTPELARAVHVYLARSPSKVLTVRLEDVAGQRRQINLPGTAGKRPNWRYRTVLELEDLRGDPRWRALAHALGEVRIPAPAPTGRRRAAWIPAATYRLQFNRDFTFVQAAELVPYLQRLGVSHCYASPYLKARAGSRHGYDIVVHNALNPELGSREDYERFVAALHAHGMDQILDIVPNHMGVGSDDNLWWLDVLENGQASAYAAYFDIDWQPLKDELRGKVLSPVLGDTYGKLLESGELKLVFHAEQGVFAVHYQGHRFPIDPRTYSHILGHGMERLEGRLGADHPKLLEFQSLITALRNLPARWDMRENRAKERRRDKEVHKRRLAELVRDHPELRQYIEENVAAFNGAGISGAVGRFDLLHGLLEEQAYRLASWRVASDEINYRRFFDINDLAGLCTENPEVFDVTHRLIFELIEHDQVAGLRIDHPDGLYDPAQYYERLQRRVAELSGTVAVYPGPEPAPDPRPLYVVAEKILASHERLPEDWRIHGATGYDFANLVNGLLVYGPAERELDRVYRRFAGFPQSFDDLLYACKKLVMRTALSSELQVLANYLDRISESDRRTRDFTRTTQRYALQEVVACFPVYRTYITGERVTEEDRRYVDWAIAAAKKRSLTAEVSVFDFIHDILLCRGLEGRDEGYRRAVVEFTMRFQQYTAPVMAKGLEDTSFYIYNRLVSLNEVGGDPRRFAVSVAAFHHANQERARHWPHALLCTSSHDTKRSEDVRVRITVLSEIVAEWRARLARWSRLNRSKKHRLNGGWAPSHNDEYLLYQTLVGVWPLEAPDAARWASLQERLQAYMLKAIREAKVHTSWINPNREYEDGVTAFVQALLGSPERNPFLADFLPFQQRVASLGLFNSLSQTLLKLTCPGVPDIYQGNELWDLSLVDPDNRRPVDYRRRQDLLQELQAFAPLREEELAVRARGLLDSLEAGTAKLYVTWRTLSLRREKSEHFARGAYLPLAVDGPRAEHLCAYARTYADWAAVTVAPRWFSRLVSDTQPLPLGPAVWADTGVEAPPGAADRDYVNVFTGARLRAEAHAGRIVFPAQALLADFPVALLTTIESAS